MKKIIQFLLMILFLIVVVACKDGRTSDAVMPIESMDDYYIVANGDLYVKVGDQTAILEINALPDGQIIEDEDQRLLILSDPTDRYQHGILGDKLEATSVTIVQLSDQPTVIGSFSVSPDWVIESILPIWSDWDLDGEKEILLTLSNKTSGAKHALYDEGGNLLAESKPIGSGFRWRQALDIAAFGEGGQRLLVDVQTPHIGGIVAFYEWNKDEKMLDTLATLSGYSTHDIGSRLMKMYALTIDEQNNQVVLILPDQSKTQLVALRLIAGEIQEEWRISLGGRLSGNLELIEDNGVKIIRTFIDDNQEVLLDFPE